MVKRDKISLILILLSINVSLLAQKETIDTRKVVEFIGMIEKDLESFPDNDTLWFLRSSSYYKLDSLQIALSSIRNAIKNNQNQKWYFDLEGDIYIAMHNYDSAINSFDKAIKIDSSKLVFYGKKVEVLLRINENKRALYTLLQAIENTPLVTGDKYNEMMKKYIWDVEDTLYFRFKKMYETDTNSNENLFLFGYISYLSNQYNQSKRLLLRYKENTPTKKYDYTASKILGLVFLREFDVETASYYLTEAYMNGIKIHQHLRKYINFE